MSPITRRAAIFGTATSTVALAIPIIAEERFDLGRLLDSAPPEAVVEFLLHQLATALQRHHGGTWKLVHFTDNGMTVATRQNAEGTDAWVELTDMATSEARRRDEQGKEQAAFREKWDNAARGGATS